MRREQNTNFYARPHIVELAEREACRQRIATGGKKIKWYHVIVSTVKARYESEIEGSSNAQDIQRLG
jgi:hypothetical protein